jgi:hypothetical protein
MISFDPNVASLYRYNHPVSIARECHFGVAGERRE